MTKLSLSALAALALSAAALSATAASAQSQNYGQRGYDNNNGGKYNDGGLGRYCPPGFYPHSWPNGIRCEAQDGRLIYKQGF